MKKQMGITLVALVISIVVMLILVGVTLAPIIREGGLYGKAKEAAAKTQNKIDYETQDLPSEMENYINSIFENK